MATIYLDSRSTSNKEDGTKEHPFKTFKSALDSTNPNDTIWDLEPHIYKSGTNSNLKNIDWSALNGFIPGSYNYR